LAERLVQHKHCPVCGKAMAVGKETCSSECAEAREEQMKAKKRTLNWFYVSIAVIVVLLVIQLLTVF
jgi:predicted nucleic acid-binding Zn ribbon protein